MPSVVFQIMQEFKKIFKSVWGGGVGEGEMKRWVVFQRQWSEVTEFLIFYWSFWCCTEIKWCDTCSELPKSMAIQELHILIEAEPRVLATCPAGTLQAVSAMLALHPWTSAVDHCWRQASGLRRPLIWNSVAFVLLSCIFLWVLHNRCSAS